jgi:hypothetical protein
MNRIIESAVGRRSFVTGVCAVIVMCYLLLAAVPDLRTAVPFLVFISALITGLLALIVWKPRGRGLPLSPLSIIAIASVIRLIFVFQPPQLSDDMYRYLWDGLQMTLGNNPYASAPSATISQSPEARTLLASVNHPDLVTVYPPGAQVVFLWAAVVGSRPWVLKLLLVSMDLASCVLIIRLLGRVNLPVNRSILYAWHPLAVLEIAGSGHIDAAAIFFLLLSLCAAPASKTVSSGFRESNKPIVSAVSGFFFVWSCLIKLYPLVFLPFFFRRVGRITARSFLAGVLAGGLALCPPFFPDLENMIHTLFRYARHWEFSGLSFLCLSRLGFSGDLSRTVLAILFLIALSAIWKGSATDSRGVKRAGTPSPFFYSLYMINLAFLFLSPTLHPWYALYLTSVLPFISGVGGFVLSWSVLLGYSVLIPYSLTGQWQENHLATFLIWAGPTAAFLIRMVISRIYADVSYDRLPPLPG